MIRVLCVDDEPQVLRLLETSLAKQPDVAVVPGALDSSTAIERLRSENIDVLVLDYNLRGEPDGLELVRQISQMSVLPSRTGVRISATGRSVAFRPGGGSSNVTTPKTPSHRAGSRSASGA